MGVGSRLAPLPGNHDHGAAEPIEFRSDASGAKAAGARPARITAATSTGPTTASFAYVGAARIGSAVMRPCILWAMRDAGLDWAKTGPSEPSTPATPGTLELTRAARITNPVFLARVLVLERTVRHVGVKFMSPPRNARGSSEMKRPSARW